MRMMYVECESNRRCGVRSVVCLNVEQISELEMTDEGELCAVRMCSGERYHNFDRKSIERLVDEIHRIDRGWECHGL